MKAEKQALKKQIEEAINTIVKGDSNKKIEKITKKSAEKLADLIIEDRKKAKKKVEKATKKT
jgi:hypothetical protein